jgi:hypothetical protein
MRIDRDRGIYLPRQSRLAFDTEPEILPVMVRRRMGRVESESLAKQGGTFVPLRLASAA